jgi:hypothetical protein
MVNPPGSAESSMEDTCTIGGSCTGSLNFIPPCFPLIVLLTFAGEGRGLGGAFHLPAAFDKGTPSTFGFGESTDVGSGGLVETGTGRIGSSGLFPYPGT